MKNYIFVAVLAVAVAAAGCAGFEHKSTTTGPSAAGVSALMGTWASASSLIPSASTCSDFKWNATELTATSVKGSFSATCAGDLKASGTAQGTLNGSVISWTANGTAQVPLLPSCAITLSGTAELGTNSIRVPYSGDTCLGKVSGVEILNKRYGRFSNRPYRRSSAVFAP
jgi:hypothetical protein